MRGLVFRSYGRLMKGAVAASLGLGFALAIGLGLSACSGAKSEGGGAARSDIAASPAARPGNALGEIRVAAWNIEWLGQPERRSGPAKEYAQSPQALAEYIEAAGAHVITLQEISDTDPTDTRPVNETLERAFEIVDANTGSDWTHALFPSRNDRNQLLGIAWDRNAVMAENADEPWALPGPVERSGSGRTIWSRPPHAIKFSAGLGMTDFYVVTVHHKSNYGGDFASHRALEAAALSEALAELMEETGERDILIVGDSNAGSTKEAAIRTYTKRGWVDLNAGDEVTFWGGRSLDRILVPADQPEFENAELTVHFEEFTRRRGWSREDFKKNLSDHYLISADFVVMEDDD